MFDRKYISSTYPKSFEKLLEFTKQYLISFKAIMGTQVKDFEINERTIVEAIDGMLVTTNKRIMMDFLDTQGVNTGILPTGENRFITNINGKNSSQEYTKRVHAEEAMYDEALGVLEEQLNARDKP